MEQYVCEVKLDYGFRSDHSIVVIEIVFDQHVRGPGHWKLNTSLLLDQDYVHKMDHLLEIELSQTFESYRSKWEIIKLATRGSTLQYAARKQKSKKNKIVALSAKLKRLETEQEHSFPFGDTDEQIRLVRHELNTLLKEKAKGASIRAQANWLENAKMPTKYFLNLEKRNAQKKTLYRLRIGKDISQNQEEILREITRFYKELYTSKLTPRYEYTEKLKIPQLPEDLRNLLEKDITEDEISEALKSLANQKAPGTDGLQADWYKVFWCRLKPFFTNLFLEIVREGKMHLSARRGILSLLEKTKQDVLDLKSWHPLTLLNTDNKLYGKVLANRLQIAVRHLVHHTQNGFIKGRHMASNLLRIMECINYCEENNLDSLLISYGFRKAFDTLEFESIFHALAAFNFGPKYINMVLTLFNEPLICAANNGYWSEFFMATRGCPQGCTYSPGIFALTVELLGLGIRQNKDIAGIRITENTEVRCGQFADDLWTFMPSTEQQVNVVLEELKNFYLYSGLEINPEKCAVLRVGPHKDTNPQYYTLKKLYWSPGSIKILGIHLHTNISEIWNENYFATLDRVKSILESWGHRNLTIIGKITVINHLVNLLFTHKFLALPSPPPSFFKKYRHMITQFLWNNSPAKIAYGKLVQDYTKLGLKLLDLETQDTALKAAWPVRIYDLEKGTEEHE